MGEEKGDEWEGQRSPGSNDALSGMVVSIDVAIGVRGVEEKYWRGGEIGMLSRSEKGGGNGQACGGWLLTETTRVVWSVVVTAR